MKLEESICAEGRVEGVGYVLYAVVVGGAVYGEEVETDMVRHRAGVHEHFGGTHYIGYLTPVDGFERVFVHVGAAFHLGKYQLVVLHGYYIEFVMALVPVSLYYGPAVSHEDIACHILAP